MDNLIGQRIKERRKELKITQTQIQQKTSISSGNLSCIENGKYLPSSIALMELSQILNCSVDWILTGRTPISGSSETLDSNEQKLLRGFRELPAEDQDELIEIMMLKLHRVQRSKEKSVTLSFSTGTE